MYKRMCLLKGFLFPQFKTINLLMLNLTTVPLFCSYVFVNDKLADASSCTSTKSLKYYMINTNGPKSPPHKTLTVIRIESVFVRVRSDYLHPVTALSFNPPRIIIILFT